MKKNNKTQKVSETMSNIKKPTKSVKNAQSKAVKKTTLVAAVSSYLSELMGTVLDDNSLELFTAALQKNESKLDDVLSSHIPKAVSVKTKKVKDPDAPKRGKSSYIFFCIDKRDEIKSANPDMGAKDITRELGRVWREDVSEKDKASYEKKAAKDKERYSSEMVDYTPPAYIEAQTKSGKKKRDGPKKALTSYIFFCNSERAVVKTEHPEMSAKDITSELGRRWREMDDNDKKPFVKLATKDKKRYESEKDGWGGDVKEADEEVKTEKVSKKEKKVSKKKVSKRKTGYILYCQENRSVVKEANPDMSNKDVTKELETNWKALSDDEQQEYGGRTNEADL